MSNPDKFKKDVGSIEEFKIISLFTLAIILGILVEKMQ